MKNVALTFVALSFAACASTKTPEAAVKPNADLARAAARSAAIQEMLENFERVRFEYDSALITSDTREALAANVDIMQKFDEIKVEVEGHCDETGSTEYNLALGERRAEAIKKYMVAASIDPARISTISFGEEAPIDDGHSPEAYSSNRRAEFRVTFIPAHLDPTPAIEPLALR